MTMGDLVTPSLIRLVSPEQRKKLQKFANELLEGHEQQIVVLKVQIHTKADADGRICYLAAYKWNEKSDPQIYIGDTPEKALQAAVDDGCTLLSVTQIAL